MDAKKKSKKQRSKKIKTIAGGYIKQQYEQVKDEAFDKIIKIS